MLCLAVLIQYRYVTDTHTDTDTDTRWWLPAHSSPRAGNYEIMAIFRFVKMAAAAILDFCNFKLLTVGTVTRVEMRHLSNFARNAAEIIMAIYRFFKMADVPHLGFVMHWLGPSTKGIWWSLSLCKIWLESIK